MHTGLWTKRTGLWTNIPLTPRTCDGSCAYTDGKGHRVDLIPGRVPAREVPGAFAVGRGATGGRIISRGVNYPEGRRRDQPAFRIRSAPTPAHFERHRATHPLHPRPAPPGSGLCKQVDRSFCLRTVPTHSCIDLPMHEMDEVHRNDLLLTTVAVGTGLLCILVNA
jgi:hypothetical protein